MEKQMPRATIIHLTSTSLTRLFQYHSTHMHKVYQIKKMTYGCRTSLCLIFSRTYATSTMVSPLYRTSLRTKYWRTTSATTRPGYRWCSSQYRQTRAFTIPLLTPLESCCHSSCSWPTYRLCITWHSRLSERRSLEQKRPWGLWVWRTFHTGCPGSSSTHLSILLCRS